jgi:3-hydroxyacyl-[acyl-carrier-protein] dehydratase
MPETFLQIPIDHPSFAGHFPGQPIVPGVVLLDAAQRIIEAENGLVLVGIAVAKFHSPAGPGDELQLDYAINNGRARFEIRCAARKIADGQFIVKTQEQFIGKPIDSSL